MSSVEFLRLDENDNMDNINMISEKDQCVGNVKNNSKKCEEPLLVTMMTILIIKLLVVTIQVIIQKLIQFVKILIFLDIILMMM